LSESFCGCVAPSELRSLRRCVVEAEKAYRRYLNGDVQGWDVVVVTVASERQAEACEVELEERRRSGVLPKRTAAFASADPDGVRVGSGTATVRALRLVEQKLGLAGRKVLIVHSGGDSRRVPFHSQSGKVFARLPRLREDGHPACVFDLLMMSLIGLSERFSEGVVVTSGDVLLAFKSDDVRLLEPGVTGLAVPVPWEQGCKHGVYIANGSGGPVVQFLQKPDRSKLTAAGGINRQGMVLVDSGLLYFDAASAEALLSLPVSEEYMDLYEDVLCSLPLRFSPDGFNDVADENRRCVRELIWKQLRGIRFHVCVPKPACFVHLGTAAQFREAVTSDSIVSSLFGFSKRVCSYLAEEVCAGGATVVGSVLSGAVEVGDGALVDGCALTGSIKVGANSVLVDLDVERGDFEVPPGVVVHRVLVGSGGTPEFAYLVYGVNDDPKLTLEAGASLFGEAMLDRLRRFGVAEEEVWPHVPAGIRSLWNARLYPVFRGDCGPGEVLWMAGQRPPSEEELSRWRTAVRISMEDSARLINLEAERARRELLLQRANEMQVLRWLREEVPTSLAFSTLCSEAEAKSVADAAERLALESELEHGVSEGCIHRARLWKIKADLLRWMRKSGAEFCEEKAFAEVKRSIISTTPAVSARLRRLRPGSCVIVEAPARIDFGGGWSDTPPHCLERGGAVLNAAVLLDGEKPVRAAALTIDEPIVRLRSADQGICAEYRFAEEVASVGGPSDPLGLHKAALIWCGIVPSDASGPLEKVLEPIGCGLELETEAVAPKGSGLGTSSILAWALLASLYRLLGIGEQPSAAHVLAVEQILTTGGGWQDQVGGAYPGFKLIWTESGLPQDVHVEPLQIGGNVQAELRDRLVLFYTGKRRLAKNILRTIMGKWLSRDPVVVYVLGRIKEIAREMRDCLERGDLNAFGALMSEHWLLNKLMDPKTSDPGIERMFAAAAPYCVGGKLAGAGGGGFMILLARNKRCLPELRLALEQASGGKGRWFAFEPDTTGPTVTVEKEGE